MGYFLQSSGRDYIIFEKNNTAGIKLYIWCAYVVIIIIIAL